MRLEDLTPAHVRQAVSIYMEYAWPEPENANPWFDPHRLEGVGTLEELFRLFTSAGEDEDRPLCARYTLRLGNQSYPFMKFVLQEYLVDSEYFFSVDTHDDLDIPEDSADYAEWQLLRLHNQRLKREIEIAWNCAALPTNEDLRQLAEGLARVERDDTKRGRLLVVDDERGVALGLEALLKARGYLVEVAYDGQQVLERLGHDPLPGLVLLDYSMPEFDGDEVLKRIRASPRTKDLPVLLATASSIDLSRMARVSGLLRKPYPRELLFAMLEQFMGQEHEQAHG